MIDPEKITDFERDEAGLQEFLLFALFAVHTNADVAANALATLLKRAGSKKAEPFKALKQLRQLLDTKNEESRPGVKADLQAILSECGLRYHGMRAEAILKLTDKMVLDQHGFSAPMLWQLKRSDLIQWHGIGMKTASFFLIHSQYDAEVACLDVHIMRYLRQRHEDAPTDPWKSKAVYEKWERVFLDHATELDYHPAELDILIWSRYRKNPDFSVKDIPWRKNNPKLPRFPTQPRARKQAQLLNLDQL